MQKTGRSKARKEKKAPSKEERTNQPLEKYYIHRRKKREWNDNRLSSAPTNLPFINIIKA